MTEYQDEPAILAAMKVFYSMFPPSEMLDIIPLSRNDEEEVSNYYPKPW